MSSVNTLGNNPLSLLWPLQQRFVRGATGADASQDTSPATPDTSTAAANASSASGSTSSTNGVTGAATPNLSSNVLFIFISMQEQQSAASDRAQNLFNSIDANGDGQTASALLQAGGHHRHHHHGGLGGAADASGDPLAGLLGGATADGATSQQTAKPDGTTTATLTYPDGTTVTLTTPAASGTASGAGDGSSASNSASSAVAGTDPAGGQNQQNMDQMLTTLIRLQAAMAPPPRLTGLAA